ncbi:hypothetical protein NDU88_002401 [Pleurodeles waltl]|uniref:Secreted protein n=1 Tax=Pleurodeles waltl TaxID=8319 RepID=A0AAV7W374_PLEWA|nr:hypothetical protein NDU88_002401 [Pleurodeles waltl]
MVWAYFCWRDGGGLVIASFPLTFGVEDFCWCRVFGGLPVAGQNDCGGLPRPRRCYGGLLTGEYDGGHCLPETSMEILEFGKYIVIGVESLYAFQCMCRF